MTHGGTITGVVAAASRSNFDCVDVGAGVLLFVRLRRVVVLAGHDEPAEMTPTGTPDGEIGFGWPEVRWRSAKHQRVVSSRHSDRRDHRSSPPKKINK